MIAFGPKKDGSPNVKYFESAETLANLEIVKQWLHKTVKKVLKLLVFHSHSIYSSINSYRLAVVSTTGTTYEQKPVCIDYSVSAIPRRQFRKECAKTTNDQNTGSFFYYKEFYT